MNEIQRRELKGLGGWLVLFQIHIFNSLAGILQLVVLVPVMRLITNSLMKTGAMSDLYGFSDGYPFNIFEFLYSPPAIAIISVLFVLTLLCIIFFYRKKIIFRTLFIIQSVVYLAGFGLYYGQNVHRVYGRRAADRKHVYVHYRRFRYDSTDWDNSGNHYRPVQVAPRKKHFQLERKL